MYTYIAIKTDGTRRKWKVTTRLGKTKQKNIITDFRLTWQSASHNVILFLHERQDSKLLPPCGGIVKY